MANDANNLTKKSSTPRQAVRGTKAVAARSAMKPRIQRAVPVSISPAPRKRPITAAKAGSTIATAAVKRAATVKRLVTGKKAVIKTAPAAEKRADAAKSGKMKKPKLVRDNFTMPKEEYAVIATLKARCLEFGMSAKKSEILRAAIATLAKLSDTSLRGAIRRLEVIKTGRPAKGSK